MIYLEINVALWGSSVLIVFENQFSRVGATVAENFTFQKKNTLRVHYRKMLQNDVHCILLNKLIESQCMLHLKLDLTLARQNGGKDKIQSTSRSMNITKYWIILPNWVTAAISAMIVLLLRRHFHYALNQWGRWAFFGAYTFRKCPFIAIIKQCELVSFTPDIKCLPPLRWVLNNEISSCLSGDMVMHC